ncbi:unnamed protein product, partial [Rotaria sp. Silwood2]
IQKFIPSNLIASKQQQMTKQFGPTKFDLDHFDTDKEECDVRAHKKTK